MNDIFARQHPEDPEAELLSREIGARSFIDFVTYTNPRYIVSEFHIRVAEILQNALEAGNKRIMIFAPPQHGKSELVSVRFPPFWIAKKPDKPIILCSYGSTLAQDKAGQAREIIGTGAYRNLFPHLFDHEDFNVNFKLYIGNLQRRIVFAGVGGSITGFGAGLGIIDDPVKNYEEALSWGRRERAWKWYQATFRTRIWENGVILIIMTRWHDDDLAGRLLNTQGEKWDVYRFPAIAEPQEQRDLIAEKTHQPKGKPDLLNRKPGQALAPNRYSLNELKSLEEDVGPLPFAAEYQGFPQAAEGNMFKEKDLIVVDVAPREVKKRIRYWDKAATPGGGCRSAGVLMSQDGHYWTIEDVVKGQWSTFQREAIIKQVAEQDEEIYGTVTVWVEEEGGAGGKDSSALTLQTLAGFDVHFEHPTKAKEVRAAPFAAQWEGGKVRMVKGQWNKEYVAEMTMFPNTAFADQVDSSSGAFLKLVRRGWSRGAGG